MPALGGAGFRAVAPFMRGFAPTAIPADGSYTIPDLINDANGLHEALGGDSNAVIIAHDWGALVGWGAGDGPASSHHRAVAVVRGRIITLIYSW